MPITELFTPKNVTMQWNFTIQWKTHYKPAAKEAILLKDYYVANSITAYNKTFG